jgi:hypothetical protein
MNTTNTTIFNGFLSVPMVTLTSRIGSSISIPHSGGNISLETPSICTSIPPIDFHNVGMSIFGTSDPHIGF